jgi:hypothetical protein
VIYFSLGCYYRPRYSDEQNINNMFIFLKSFSWNLSIYFRILFPLSLSSQSCKGRNIVLYIITCHLKLTLAPELVQTECINYVQDMRQPPGLPEENSEVLCQNNMFRYVDSCICIIHLSSLFYSPLNAHFSWFRNELISFCFSI